MEMTFSITDPKYSTSEAVHIPAESKWIGGLFVSRSGIEGQGVFTTTNIKRCSVAIRWGGVVFSEQDLHNGRTRQHTYVGIDDGVYLAVPSDKEAYNGCLQQLSALCRVRRCLQLRLCLR